MEVCCGFFGFDAGDAIEEEAEENPFHAPQAHKPKQKHPHGVAQCDLVKRGVCRAPPQSCPRRFPTGRSFLTAAAGGLLEPTKGVNRGNIRGLSG